MSLRELVNKTMPRKKRTQPADPIVAYEQAYMEAMQAMAMPLRPRRVAPLGALEIPTEKPKPPSVNAEKLEALKTAEPYKVVKPAPDYVEVITGWRAWDINVSKDGVRLEALGKRHIWQPKKMMEAVCVAGSSPFAALMRHSVFGPSDEEPTPTKHAAPQEKCTCGIWAFKDVDRLVAAIGNQYSQIRVLGKVSLWGRVVETVNGYRAQYAYPSELWLFDESLEELGLIYDVPVRKVG